MAKIVTLGEIMLRLSTPCYNRIVQSDSFDVCYGGGEANVAVSLANFNHNVYYVTKLPKNDIGESALNILRRYNVNCDYIVRGGERLGIYFLETGASMRPSKVIYDRVNSAIAKADPCEFDFDKIFEGAEWFHITGITPAISDNGIEITKTALKAAKKHNVMVSFDLNYRKKLWSEEKAKEVMTSLMEYVDVFIGGMDDASKCLGYEKDVNEKELDEFQSFLKDILNKFHFKYAATTIRDVHSASDNGISALIYDGKEFYYSKKYEIRIVDRIGGGDAFAAGLIHGLLTMENMKDALEFAVAAGALKHTINGDYNLVNINEVEELAKGNASGRIER